MSSEVKVPYDEQDFDKEPIEAGEELEAPLMLEDFPDPNYDITL